VDDILEAIDRQKYFITKSMLQEAQLQSAKYKSKNYPALRNWIFWKRLPPLLEQGQIN
jgi:hypothetical protein